MCQELRITLQPVPSNSSELNGRIERANRTIMEMTRSMLLHSGLSAANWPDAIRYARTILNLLPKTEEETVGLESSKALVKG
jgi:hypothetical protein